MRWMMLLFGQSLLWLGAATVWFKACRSLSVPYARRLAFGMALVTVGAAAGIYGRLGAYSELKKHWYIQDHQAEIQAWRAQIKTPQRAIELLQEQIRLRPKDPQARLLLGRLYMDTGEYGLAAATFSEARRQHPDDLSLALHYAQADYWQHDRRLSEEGQKALSLVEQKHRKHPEVLLLRSGDALSRGDRTRAIAYLQTLLETLDPNSPEATSVLNQITDIQKNS